MASVQVHDETVSLSEPTLIEGLPGVGLVGKIATDHLIENYEMTHYGSMHCDGLPEVAVYQEGDDVVRPPVRLYADEANDLVVLTSDVPVSPNSAEDFADCVMGWLTEHDATPVFLSGLPTDKDDVPRLSGVSTGDGGSLLDAAGIDPPGQDGAITGPTGALVYEAQRQEIDGVGLVVEADPQFPDPEAARVVLLDGVGPIAGLEPETDRLVEQAEDISEAKAKLAEQMQEGGDESTSARPLGFQ